MTHFDVQPAALRELAGMLVRARDDIDKASSYLAKMENFEGGTGYLGWCLHGTRRRTARCRTGLPSSPIPPWPAPRSRSSIGDILRTN